MTSLSVCIVTKDEALNIQDCLETVKFADEIIIVDSYSDDNTVELSRKYTNNITVTRWKGCGPQKKHAVSLATKEWVLIIDADERLTPALQAEIQNVIKSDKYVAYNIPFQSFYLGKPIRFGDWIFEKHLRLFKRDCSSVVPRLVHFRIETNGPIGNCKHKVLHNSFPSLDKVLHKINIYSTDGAKQKHNEGKTTGLLNAIGHGIFTFIRGYILKLGFLDGKEGLILAISNAEGTYYRYLKLLYTNQGHHNSKVNSKQSFAALSR